MSLGHAELKLVYKALRGLPHFREFKCSECGHINRYCVVQIRQECSQCDTEHKLRSLGACSEPQDVISLVLTWLEACPSPEVILQAHKQLGAPGWGEWDEYFDDDEDAEV